MATISLFGTTVDHSNVLRNSYSFSVDAGTDANRVLVVWVFGFEEGGTPTTSTPTYNGVSLTKIGTGINRGTADEYQLYYLEDPASGSNTLAGGWDINVDRTAVIAKVFHGADSVNTAKHFTKVESAAPGFNVSVDAATATSLLPGAGIIFNGATVTPGDEETETAEFIIEADNTRMAGWAGIIDPNDTLTHDFDGTWDTGFTSEDYLFQAIEVTEAPDPHFFADITDLPADFGNAETAEIVVRTRGVDIGATPLKLYAQLFQSDETTALSDEVEVASHSSSSSFANSSPVTFTGLNTTAAKSVWDNARIRFRWGT